MKESKTQYATAFPFFENLISEGMKDKRTRGIAEDIEWGLNALDYGLALDALIDEACDETDGGEELSELRDTWDVVNKNIRRLIDALIHLAYLYHVAALDGDKSYIARQLDYTEARLARCVHDVAKTTPSNVRFKYYRMTQGLSGEELSQERPIVFIDPITGDKCVYTRN